MGSANLFHRRKQERKKREIEKISQRPDNWLIVCEGEKTEVNYFKELVNEVNKFLPNDKRIKAEVIGEGKNTLSLVRTATVLQRLVDNHKTKIPYGKIFIVFDKDDFSDKDFDEAIELCGKNNYIPLWSNQAIEYWFLLHFSLIECRMSRDDYKEKLDKCFKSNKSNYRYKKNASDIYFKLNEYGSIDSARRNSKRIHDDFLIIGVKPSKSESCTTIYKLFDMIDERNEELE